ncbi:tripartite tricarboxylate transporter permease [Methanococcus voltae]|uniref:DUF112 domain-containing protein n=1 Tax=Methanococcus voltae (strain ATCC BAA-1334 / A3) TaxID=456320 RepID=D7DUF1_METV3|nr:tripartite tricarboxylate transporter permease [Methanococcus voltae]MCS3900561.1 putative membrane protein [Methanococcus voltae]
MHNLIFALLSIFAGVICGICTGLCIGIHPNLFLPTVAFLTYEYTLNDNLLIYFLISWVISHYFINYIPTAYFGVPDSETAVSVNILQKYVKQGNAHNGIFASGLGGLLSVLLSTIIILSLFGVSVVINVISNNTIDVYSVISVIYGGLKNYMAYILSILLILAILSEKNRLWTIILSIISGLFGIYTLSINPSFDITLTLVFTGMFGIPILIHNVLFGNFQNKDISKNLNDIYTPKMTFEKESLFNYFYYSLMGTIGGFFRIIIPAFGGSQINYFLGVFVRKIQNIQFFQYLQNLLKINNNSTNNNNNNTNNNNNNNNNNLKSLKNLENFLISQGAIVISNEMLSIWALMVIGVGRSGSAQLISNLNVDLELFKLLGVSLISAVLSFVLLLKISKIFSNLLLKTQKNESEKQNGNKISYKKISKYLLFGIVSIITILTFLSQNMLYNIIIFAISIILGLLCLYKNVNTSILMSYLIYPTILFYLLNF